MNQTINVNESKPAVSASAPISLFPRLDKRAQREWKKHERAVLDVWNDAFPPESAYPAILRKISAVLTRQAEWHTNILNAVHIIKDGLPDLVAVEIYFRNGPVLELGGAAGNVALGRLEYGRGHCGKAAETGEVMNIPDVNKSPDWIKGHPDVRSELVIPLKADGRVIGVMDLCSKEPGRFDETDEKGCVASATLFTGWHERHGNIYNIYPSGDAVAEGNGGSYTAGDMKKSAIDLNAEVAKLGFTPERALETLRRLSDAGRETLDRAAAEPRPSAPAPRLAAGGLEDLAAKAGGETTARIKAEPRTEPATADAATEFNQKLAAIEAEAVARGDGTLLRRVHAYRDGRQALELPEKGGFTNIADAQAAGRLSATFRNLQDRIEEVGLKRLPDDPVVTEARRLKSLFYRQNPPEERTRRRSSLAAPLR